MKRPALLCAVLCAGGLAQAEPVTPLTPLTIERAYQLAIDRNPDLAMAHETVVQADLARTRSRAPLLPTITASGTYTRNESEVSVQVSPGQPPIVIQALDQLSANGRVHIPVLAPSAIVDYVGQGVNQQVTRETFQRTRQQLLLAVARAYYDAVASAQALAVAKQSRELRAAHLERQKVLQANGAATPTAVTQAEIDLADADGQVLDAGAAAETGVEALRLLVRVDGPFEVAAPADAEDAAPPDADDEAALLAEAYQRRPDLRAARIAVDNRGTVSWSARAKFIPEVGIDLNGVWTNASGFSGKSFFWTAALTATWTLYDGGARYADLDARQSDVRTVELRELSQRGQVAADVRDAIVQARRARDRWQLARRQVALTRENETRVRARFDAGAATPLELSDAETRRVTAEINAVVSVNALRLARVVRDVAVGRDPAPSATSRRW